MKEIGGQVMQEQMFYASVRSIADLNAAFLELIDHPTNPMTNDDLRKLIARRPGTYGRFMGFLEKLRD